LKKRTKKLLPVEGTRLIVSAFMPAGIKRG